MNDSTSFDPYLEPWLTARVPRMADYSQQLADFHYWVHTEVDAQANYTDRYAPPALETYDRNGEVVNRIVANRWYDEQHQELYRRGIIGLPYAEKAPHLLTFTMGYSWRRPTSACIARSRSPARLLMCWRRTRRTLCGSAFSMTLCAWMASPRPAARGRPSSTAAAMWERPPLWPSRSGDRFALHGLKWFTSNANSGLAVATARPEGAAPGSAGLGLYLVPSHLEDGRPNHYRIRKLKDKLGTKGLPTGEIDLLGAEAVEIAPPPEGFKLMMEALEYSRVHNAVGSAGMQRRALREALAWAKTRRAFGHVLSDYPMVQDELLRMRVQFEAGALLAFEAAHRVR